MKLLYLLVLCVFVYGENLPFADSILNIVNTAVDNKNSDGLPYANDIVQIVKDGINLGKHKDGKNNNQNNLKITIKVQILPKYQ